jgi:ATP adenylyltransferase
MDRLWAPWRLEYITTLDKPEGCIFCNMPLAGDDCGAHIVLRGTHSYIMLNAFPYNNGHILIVPYSHVSRLEELPSETLHEMMDLSQLSARAFDMAFHAEGINVGFNLGSAAGAGIADHLHLHMVPRWEGDTNFMPVIGDTRVIPQSLEISYKLLSNAYKELQG